jgi:hypothetical protein
MDRIAPSLLSAEFARLGDCGVIDVKRAPFAAAGPKRAA